MCEYDWCDNVMKQTKMNNWQNLNIPQSGYHED